MYIMGMRNFLKGLLREAFPDFIRCAAFLRKAATPRNFVLACIHLAGLLLAIFIAHQGYPHQCKGSNCYTLNILQAFPPVWYVFVILLVYGVLLYAIEFAAILIERMKKK